MKMDDFAHDSEIEKSKYNEANLNIQRLHNSWEQIRDYRRTANYPFWFNELKLIWSELVQDVNKNRMHNYEKTELEYVNHLKTCQNAIISMNVGTIEIKLMKLNDFLRRLQDEVGKGGTYDDGTGEEAD